MMAINDTVRQYLTLSEAGTNTQVNVNIAEELIDAYVGYQNKHVKTEYRGEATGGTATTLIDTSSDSSLSANDDYFKYCVVQMMSGNNEGEYRGISGYDKDTQTITVNDAFSNAIANGDAYTIHQLGKFPRVKDTHSITETFYKVIPSQVKRAVQAQLDYIVEMGDDFFESGSDVIQESIDDYSYQLKEGQSDIKRLVAPKARNYLCRIMNNKGQFPRPVHIR